MGYWCTVHYLVGRQVVEKALCSGAVDLLRMPSDMEPNVWDTWRVVFTLRSNSTNIKAHRPHRAI